MVPKLITGQPMPSSTDKSEVAHIARLMSCRSDRSRWREMLLEEAEPPEDWRAAFELDDDDLVDPDLPMHPEDWANPVSSIEPDAMYGVEDI